MHMRNFAFLEQPLKAHDQLAILISRPVNAVFMAFILRINE